jgi:hypothetical protein
MELSEMAIVKQKSVDTVKDFSDNVAESMTITLAN